MSLAVLSHVASVNMCRCRRCTTRCRTVQVVISKYSTVCRVKMNSDVRTMVERT